MASRFIFLWGSCVCVCFLCYYFGSFSYLVVLSFSNLFYFVLSYFTLFYYYMPACFLMKGKKNVELDGREDGEE